MQRLSDYRPAHITDADWTLVRPFVVAVVGVVDAPAASVPALAGVATQLALWARQHGFPLDAATLLSPAAIEAFVATKAANQGTVRSWLRRIAAANGVAATSSVSITYGQQGKKTAYMEDEIEQLWRFANGLSNEHRRRSLRAVLALGLGCGLAAGEMLATTAADVHVHDDNTVGVQVTERCVPVLARWADELLGAASVRESGPLIAEGTSRNQTSKPNKWTTGHAGVPPLSIWRMRATWVVEHLTLGTSLVELMHWMNVRNVEALQAYYEQVSYVPPCRGGQR